MTEKQIIKAIELAEGFECKIELDRKIVEYKNRYYTLKDLYKWEHYPLLLYRAMEDFNLINIKDDYKYIDLDADIINYSSGVNSDWQKGEDGSKNIWYSNYTSTLYLTAQEQSLEAALEEVL